VPGNAKPAAAFIASQPSRATRLIDRQLSQQLEHPHLLAPRGSGTGVRADPATWQVTVTAAYYS